MRGTINNYVKWSSKFGGVRKCFEGHTIVAVGGFSINKNNMPTYGNALAAGTPVYADEQARTIVPLYTFKVLAVDTTHVTIKVAKNENGTTAKVGMVLGVVGSDLTSAVSNVSTVSAIDSSDPDFDILTVDAVADDGTAFVAADDILAEFNGSTKKVKVVPNGYLYNDIYLGNLDDSEAAVTAKTIAATGAVVKFHHEGLIVELTPSAALKAQMAAAVPGVLQVLV